MMPLRTPFLAALFIALAPTSMLRAEPAAAALPSVASIVKVNSTNQAYNFVRPWTKRSPFDRRGIGVVIDGGRILVTAELIANHNFVELERPANSEKVTATVEFVDYESNLAILKPVDPKFLEGTQPVSLAKDVKVGAKINVAQLEPTGALALTPATVTTISVNHYPVDSITLLTYRISAPLQYRDYSFTLPVFLGDRLAGLLMRYDSRSQSADLVPDAVITNFLERIARKPYQGFPRAGLTFSPTRDPQFRRYLGMKAGQSGVYIASVLHGSPAEKAGLRKGDVLMQVDGEPLDEDGNYDDPTLGKIPFGHLISTVSLPGGTLALHVLRDGKEVKLDLPLEPRDPASVISEPAIFDRAPRYYILGGLVFQELSQPFLREWGANWKSDAPARLVYLDEFQDELPPDQGKIVFLSQVLPTDTTLGYDDVEGSIVKKVNGRPIHNLNDLAAAAEHPVNGFDEIDLESDPGVLYLDAQQVKASEGQLRESYGLPALDNLGDPSTKAGQ
ncbi:MAG TPA: PDZ domain-containing protein [Chthoniobacterales bacterium]